MKKKLLLLIVSVVLAMPFYAQEDNLSTEKTMSVNAVADSIIKTAKTFIGTPYVHGANGPKSFDCTGFTCYLYKNIAGIKLHRTSKAQATNGREVKKGHYQKGDIVIFTGRKNNGVPGHAGIFLQYDNEEKTSFSFIHASVKGVRISKITESYYKPRFLGVRRVLPDIEDFCIAADTAQYPFEEVGFIQPDTIQLDSADNRVVLFANGLWAYVSAAGEVIKPKEDDKSKKIVLNPDGTWGYQETAKIKVPAERPVQKDNSSTSQKQSSPANNQSNQKATTKQQNKKATNSKSSATYHTVKQGDTLYALAIKYKTTVKAICKLNNIKETSILKLGQKLRVK